MDTLLMHANMIINKLDVNNLELGYTKMNEELYREIPKFTKLLNLYANYPKHFVNILRDVYSHWGDYLGAGVRRDINNYYSLLNNFRQIELDRQKSLMELAMQHPENIKAQENDIDILASSIENMFSPTSDLADLLKKTNIGKKTSSSISKHKLPKRNTKKPLK